jgi:S-adenosylmethionine synthetase
MRNIYVEKFDVVPVEEQKSEVVERKGIGHPDSVADGLAESVSVALCKEYVKEFGYIMHHNTDECQIVGGQSEPTFGGGVILEPVYILLVGRATSLVGKKRLPIRAIAVRAAHEYLEKNFANLDADTDVTMECKIWQGSQALRSVYDARKKLANDTSFGVGFAPLSETEKIVLETDNLIHNVFKKQYKEIGDDTKVMASRYGDNINLTVAIAMVCKYVPDADHYMSLKEEIKEKILDNAAKLTNKNVNVYVNTADQPENNVFYLTVTGLSMENGDDGSVGRGNRANGLITPYRPMSLEAVCGKNPVTHVGKLYNLLAQQIADNVVKECNDVKECYVYLLSQIGKPIDEPSFADVRIVMKKNDQHSFNTVREDVRGIIEERLEKIGDLTELIVNRKIKTF